MHMILPGVYRLSGMTVGNVYLIDEPGGITLIDASIPPSGKRILAQVGQLGRQPSDVRRILITHAHPDHIGSLPELKRATGAEVLVSAADRPFADGSQPPPSIPPQNRTGLARYFAPTPALMPGTPIDRSIVGGETLPVLGGLQVIDTPGHSPGHVSFWQPQLRLLFCGDVLFHLLGVSLPPSFFTYDMAQNKRSITTIAALDPNIVCFGHGPPIVTNTAATLRAFATKM